MSKTEKLWQGEYECAQCGMGGEDLVDESRPVLLRDMGRSASVRCSICGHEFMVKVAR